MALQVCECCTREYKHAVTSHSTEEPGDYTADSGTIEFGIGDINKTHTVIINQDDICEIDPFESFFSNLALVSGVPVIDVIRPRAEVIIDDSMEPECGMEHHYYI